MILCPEARRATSNADGPPVCDRGEAKQPMLQSLFLFSLMRCITVILITADSDQIPLVKALKNQFPRAPRPWKRRLVNWARSLTNEHPSMNGSLDHGFLPRVLDGTGKGVATM